MLKSIATLSAAALLITPTALADAKAVKVSITYDRELVTTEAGTAALKASVHEEAVRACEIETSLSFYRQVDAECVADIEVKALAKIADAERELGVIPEEDRVILSAN